MWLVCKIEWKLKRGTWRPKLLDYAKAVSDAEIQQASKAAFLSLKTLTNEIADDYTSCCEAALKPLVKIKVGFFLRLPRS